MKLLHYAGGSVPAADETCDAILRYASALAIARKADRIRFQVRTPDGAVGFADMLVGPASQLFTVPIDGDDVDEDPEFVADLLQRERRLISTVSGSSAAPGPASAPSDGYPWEL